jgi:hypothetical protein
VGLAVSALPETSLIATNTNNTTMRMGRAALFRKRRFTGVGPRIAAPRRRAA